MIKTDRYTLYLDDCRNVLKQIDDNSIDLIITDPPYFIDGMGNDWNKENLSKKVKKAKVVGGLPVGMKFDVEQGKKLQEFLEPICNEFMRILKPGGFCIIFSQARLYHRMAIATENAGFEIRDMLGWKYEGQAKAFSLNHFVKRMKNLTEEEQNQIIKDMEGWKTPQLKPQIEPMVMAQKPKEGTFIENWIKYNVGLVNTTESLDGMFPGNIMEVSKKEKESNIEHLTVKPVKLISHLVKLFSKENQIVLDAFMGSGSHGVASLQNNRKFIGIEIDKDYFEIAKNRIEKNI
jgi:site-specific DNA-methyltransferase (adenine-specific)